MMKNNDMSEYMRSGPLLKTAYLLAGENTAVYINAIKPSLRGLFAFGSFGRLNGSRTLIFEPCTNYP